MKTELEEVVDLLQEYVICLKELQKPVVKMETEAVEAIQVNQKQIFEEKQEKQDTHNDNTNSYFGHFTSC